MPVPKKKTSKMKKGLRRSHHKIEVINATKCPKCLSPKLPHRVCLNCGTYKGKEILAPKD